MTQFTPNDVTAIRTGGAQMTRKPRNLYVYVQTDAFEVITDGKTFTGKAGDAVAYDPISGNIWLVTANRLSDYQNVTA